MPGCVRFICSFIILFDCSISSRRVSKPCGSSSLSLLPQEGPSWGNPTGNIVVWGHTDTACTLRMAALHLLLVLFILSAVLNRHLLPLGQYLLIPNPTVRNSSTLSLAHSCKIFLRFSLLASTYSSLVQSESEQSTGPAPLRGNL